MAYIYSQQDLAESWQRFASFVQSEGVGRLLAARVMAEQMGHPTDVISLSPARMAAILRGNRWLGMLMYAGGKKEGIMGGGPAGSRIAVPVLYQGSPVVEQSRFSATLGEHGQGFFEVYRTLFEMLGERDTPFTLYAHRRSNAFLLPHDAEDMPAIRIPEGMLRDPKALTLEMARQTAPIYQFAYLYDTAGMVRAEEAAFRQRAERIGMTPADLHRMLSVLHERNDPSMRNPIVSTAAHEFAHATVQPFPLLSTQTVERYARGELNLEDLLARSIMARAFLNEGQADLFAMGVSLDPMSMVSLRYFAGARSMLTKSQGGLPQGFKLGDPIKLRVIDPRTVESTESPLYRTIQRYTRSYAQAVLDPSSAPNTGDSVADARALSMEQEKRVAYRNIMARESLTNSAGEFVPALMGRFVKAHGTLVEAAMRGMVGDYAEGVLDVDDEDARTALSHYGSRLWSVGYIVGKARPDLVGKELLVSPQGVTVEETGEQIDLGRMGLPDLNIMSLDESPPEMHPVQLQRGFRAIELYNRAREALKQGFQFAPPQGGSAADVVKAWRDQLWKVMNR